ncbi:OmpW family outer membrane protein [Pseudomonas panipatensis]|uniref:Outer membrane protein n=1 Tax=Pseudomonas panipatensis TaxID=428992 RepID=A0A1G8EKF9_9PSED|nr:OmpW family outer membrane protein [Pseudomonas panipatensis]SDH70340.1 outer membrane protein [Pseudomonas panipatensis]SMP68244.1 outer membrane protein [Pseudomonas panipatensis]
MRKSWLTASLLAAAIATPFAAQAAEIQGHKAGDFIVRGGIATVAPNDDSGNLKFDGVKASGTKATVDSDSQLGLTFSYLLTDQLGVELVAATPFKHQIDVKGLGGGLDGKLGDVKQLPPTVLLQYYPMGGTNSAFQPYGGIGVNYTTFFGADLTSTREDQGFSNLKLQDSWGLAAELGMDYMLTEHALVNASIWYMDIDTKATVDGPTALGINQTKVKVSVDPWVYMVGFGYRF